MKQNKNIEILLMAESMGKITKGNSPNKLIY